MGPPIPPRFAGAPWPWQGPGPWRAPGWVLGLALGLGLGLLCGGCATALLGGAAASAYPPAAAAPPDAPAAEDAALSAAVRARLRAPPLLRAADIRVVTRAAVVSLAGEVATADARSMAERVARQTRGVRAVRNELRINGEDIR